MTSSLGDQLSALLGTQVTGAGDADGERGLEEGFRRR